MRAEGMRAPMTFSRISPVLRPGKSFSPVSISKRTDPRLKMSLRLSARSSTTISGAM